MALRNQHNPGFADRVYNVYARLNPLKKETTYPVKTYIIQSNGRVKLDHAARFTYDDYEAYELQSDGTELKAPNYGQLYSGPNGEDVLIVGSPEKGVYEPLEVDWDDLEFKPGDNSWLEWQVQSMRRRHEEWKEETGGLLTHPAAPIVATGIFMFLTLVGFTYYWQNGLTQINGMVDAMIQSGRAAAEARP